MFCTEPFTPLNSKLLVVSFLTSATTSATSNLVALIDPCTVKSPLISNALPITGVLTACTLIPLSDTFNTKSVYSILTIQYIVLGI